MNAQEIKQQQEQVQLLSPLYLEQEAQVNPGLKLVLADFTKRFGVKKEVKEKETQP